MPQLREELASAQHHLHQQAGKKFFPASYERNSISDTKTTDSVRFTGPSDCEPQQPAILEMPDFSNHGETHIYKIFYEAADLLDCH
jgi:hypothetical protein